MRDIQQLDIEELAFGGDAIGHLPSGKVIFVRGAAAGDRVGVEIVEEKASFARAQVVEVIAPSPERVEPPCPLAGRCGGCDWMHVDVAAQRAWKSKLLLRELSRSGIAAAESTLAEVVAGSELGYRTRCRLHLRGSAFGTLAARSHEVLPFDRCPILAPPLESFARAFAAALEGRALGDADIELYVDARGRRGFFAVLSALGDTRGWEELAAAVDAAAFGVMLPRAREPASSAGTLQEDSAGRPLLFQPGQFVQANREMNARLVEQVVELAGDGKGQTFVEIYAGVGNFTVHLIRSYRRGRAHDSDARAVAMLERNVGKGPDRLRASAEPDWRTARRIADLKPFDLLVADPPRAGMKAMRPLFGAAPPARVVMVSCHPMTALRDLARICEGGRYKLLSVTPIDLFPQTPHLELVALLERSR